MGKVIADEDASGIPADLLVLLGDAPPHPEKVGECLKYHSRKMDTDYRTECKRLASAGTRMLCGYYGRSACETFREMAKETGGEAFEVQGCMASEASSEVIANVVCPKVLEIIGGANLVDSYNRQYNNALWRG